MKKLLDFWCKKIPAPIPVFCYCVCILFWLMASIIGFGYDAARKASGSLAEFDLTVEEFTLVNIEQGDEAGLWHTTTDDPQMHWQVPKGTSLKSLHMTAEFDKSPREMCLYYTTKNGEDFSQDKRVFAVQQADGSYLYTLPGKTITAIRLDPCSARNLDMQVHSIVCNEPVSPLSYFAPGWYGAFQMVIWPALAAAALSTLRQLLLKLKNKS